MKKISLAIDRRILVAATALVVGLLLSYLAPVAEQGTLVVTGNPAQICPLITSAGSTSAYLPKAKLGIRSINGKSTRFVLSPRSIVPLTTSALLVDSNPGTSLSYSSLASSGVAVVPCTAGDPETWFIGGSGGLTSKGVLDLVNSGLSESVVEIAAFTSKAAIPALTVKVKANSSATVPLDVLAPGEESIALHLITRTGRIAAFVLDQRAKGLRSLGLDYVKPNDAPHNSLFISGLYPHRSEKSGVASALRLLNPGSLDATVQVQAISADGRFIPVGFDGLVVKHGLVTTIPLANLTTSSLFGLQIDSDQPILAGALTTSGSGDFAWAAPSTPLTSFTTNFGGLTPSAAFIGSAIKVRVSGQFISGKSFNQTIQGSEIALWTPKAGVKNVHFTAMGGAKIYAGAVINTGGLSYIPLTSGAVSANTALPFNDVHTLTH
jgi:hypothetical protein